MTPIPQCNPRAGYLAHQQAIDEAMARVIESGLYILGPEVDAFEREFGDVLGGRACVGTASGTDALELALRACNIGPGDAVVTVSLTATATIAAIERAGAEPLFCDIDPETLTMDPASLGAVLDLPAADRVKAVIPVHLFGHPADMPQIIKHVHRKGLVLIEDCAQAHGAERSGHRVGTFGDFAAFSFYPTKNLGALGDGGMVVAQDPEKAERVRRLRQYGWRVRYVSESVGMNSRLDEIQAAVLRAKLPHLKAENERRQRIAAIYADGLAGSELLLPSAHPEAMHVYHQYVVRSSCRNALKTGLEERGVSTLIHYPEPVHRQPAYADRIPLHVPLEITEAVVKDVLSLPMFPELSDQDAERVCRETVSVLGTIT